MAHIRVYLNDVLLNQIEFDEGKLTIGRDSSCDLVINNAGVSSLHAVIEKTGNSYVLIDNDSTNGVFVNGNRVSEHELKYWDEIQLYNYVLKFMATAGLQDTDDPDVARDASENLDGTMEVDLSNVQDLLKLREQKKEAYLELPNGEGGQPRVYLKEANYTIGRSKTSDLRTSGWFAPALAAEIQRHADGYYLITHRRGKTLVNSVRPDERVRLVDGDILRIRNIHTTFFHRTEAT